MSVIRLSGIASGLDTDKMISDIMKAERAVADKVKKEKTETQWKQDAYRDIIKKVHDFQNKHLDVLNPKSNFKSATSFAEFDISKTVGDKDTSAVSVLVRGTGSKKLTIDRIDQIATADHWVGNKLDLNVLKSKKDIDIDAIKSDKNVEFTLSIGKLSKKISLNKMSDSQWNAINTTEDLATAIREEVKKAFGEDFQNVVKSDGNRLVFESPGMNVKIMNHDNNTAGLRNIAIDSGSSTEDYKRDTIGKIFDINDGLLSEMEFDGKKINLHSDMTISEMVDTINKAVPDIELDFSDIRGKFDLKSKKTGSAYNLDIDKDSKFGKLVSKIMGSSLDQIERTKGQNAKYTVEGANIVSLSNEVFHGGLQVTLKEASDKEIKIESKTNTKELFEKIKTFIEDYNDIINTINDKLNEKSSGLDPLTEEERKALSKDEVEKYEEKAKKGLLRNDQMLTSLVYEMRNVFISKVDGAGIAMNEIGISTGDWKDKGKLKIDETKLKNSIENKYDNVVALFTKNSDINYTEFSRRKERTAELGVSSRLDDIMKNYTRVTRDSKGNKGSIVDKAGVLNDASQATSSMSKTILNYDKKLFDLQKKLAEKEETYYRRFAAMERALAEMQSQTAQLLGGLGK